MKQLKSIAARQPVVFVISMVILWFILLLAVTALASIALHRPYGDAAAAAIGRLVTTACVLWLIWRMGWLDASGITRMGRWQAWLIALAGSGYFACASLYSFYGEITFNFSNLIHSPAARAIVGTHFTAGLCEEILFRGIVLYSLVRVWGGTKKGMFASVVLTAVLFAGLHLIQVFTAGISPISAQYLALETVIISIWWGALVLWGGSIWPVVMVHFAGNALLAVQGLVSSMIEPDVLAYRYLLWFSIPLGVLGAGMLVRITPRKIVPV